MITQSQSMIYELLGSDLRCMLGNLIPSNIPDFVSWAKHMPGWPLGGTHVTLKIEPSLKPQYKYSESKLAA